MTADPGRPKLSLLTPDQAFEFPHQRYIALSRFHGSQKLKLMRATRLPANSRRYTPGDPVQLIDWRSYARNEQLTIKEQHDEASCRITIALDLTETSDWPNNELALSPDDLPCTKREIIWRIGLHLAYQTFRGGDQANLICLEDQTFKVIPLKSQIDVMIAYEKLRRTGFVWQDRGRTFEIKRLRSERHDLFYLLSDGLNGVPQWLDDEVFQFASWVHVMSSLELEDDWIDPKTFYFDEGGTQHEYRGQILLENGLLGRKVREWCESRKIQWLKRHSQYLLFTDKTSIQSYLSAIVQPWSMRKNLLPRGS